MKENAVLIMRVKVFGLYSAFTDKVERNCHFPAPGWNRVTRRQALQCFLDTSQVFLHKAVKSTCLYYSSSYRQVTFAFNFIIERTV
jgi:hypothetical protein